MNPGSTSLEVQQHVMKMVHMVGYCIFGQQFPFTHIPGKTIDKRARTEKKKMFIPFNIFMGQ